jgi:hypothetical protein
MKVWLLLYLGITFGAYLFATILILKDKISDRNSKEFLISLCILISLISLTMFVIILYI